MAIRWKLLTWPVLWGAVLSPMYSYAKSPVNVKADHIVVLKSKRELQLWSKGTLLKSYRISLGGAPVGRKEQQGDHRTPEGNYVITGRNSHSKFHRALRISYPNPEDRTRAAKRGVSPGGDIMIHGLPNGYGWVGRGHLARDWTDGCIAVTNKEIEEIWDLVPDGAPVEIRP
ncbi:MAG: L,D-transpeptidase family protein [Terriglobia bacterium]|jgi:murein L,D-transpeptidase YafK|nr:L,D-transpeptidase family protein [Terriglobia bacterium]